MTHPIQGKTFEIKKEIKRRTLTFLSIGSLIPVVFVFSILYLSNMNKEKAFFIIKITLVTVLFFFIFIIFMFWYYLNIKYILTKDFLYIKPLFGIRKIFLRKVEDIKVLLSKRPFLFKEKEMREVVLTYEGKKIRIPGTLENFDKFVEELQSYIRENAVQPVNTEKEIKLYYSFIIKTYYIILSLIFVFITFIWMFVIIHLPDMVRNANFINLITILLFVIIVPLFFYGVLKGLINSFRTYIIRGNNIVLRTPFREKVIKIEEIKDLKDFLGKGIWGLEIITSKGKYYVDTMARNYEEFVDTLKDKFYKIKREKSP